jgi:hypothetical protein
MNGTLKLGLMVATTLLVLTAIAWVLAEVTIFLTKDDE